MNEVVLSIIVPVFNREKIISNLLNNFLEFDYNDIEIIIVDDGSTDNTFSILNSFSKYKNLKFKLLKQENKGPGGARNSGVSVSTGNYLWFVDSDDKVFPEIYHELKALLSEKFDIITFDVLQSGKVLHTMEIGYGKYNFNLSSLFLGELGTHCNKMYKRELWINNKIKYPEKVLYEDNYLPFVLPYYIQSVFKLDLIGYEYIVDNYSVTRTGQSFGGKDVGRLLTAYEGLKYSVTRSRNSAYIDHFFNYFLQLFLINTSLLIARDFYHRPNKSSFDDLKKLNRSLFYILKEMDFSQRHLYVSLLRNRKGKDYILSLFLVMIFYIYSNFSNLKYSIENYYNVNEAEWK